MDSKSAINFFKGHPSFRLLPNDSIIEATKELLENDKREYDDDPMNRHPLTYGANEGALWVREAICNFNNDKIFKFEKGFKGRSTSEALNLTSGASYGVLNILLQTTLPHTGYTKQAFIITPTYFLINDCFIDAGFGNKLTAITEVRGDSIDLEMLEDKLKYYESIDDSNEDDSQLSIINNPQRIHSKKIYKYVIYLVPTYSNPSGNTYNLETRHKLIDLARRFDMLIITDDVYDMLNYSNYITDSSPLPTPTKRIVHLDRETCSKPNSFGNTISNATFSKIIAPGLRFGYHESINEKLSLQLSNGGANVSGGTPSQLNSMIVGTMLQNGSAEKVLRNLITTYKERFDKICDSITNYMPNGTHFNRADGGYFIWMKLPAGFNAHEIGSLAEEEEGVVLANGSCFEVIGCEKDWGHSCIRLSISFLEASQIEEGIKLLGKICELNIK